MAVLHPRRAAAVRSEFPDVTGEWVAKALRELADDGHLYDAAAADSTTLTARQRERYGRSMAYFRWVDRQPRGSCWEPQERLADARVAVVGLGGAGGSAALALAASGVGHLHCVDGDRVELSNLNRQILYTEQDLGKAKADAAATRLRQVNSDIDVTAQKHHIGSADDLRRLAQDTDLVLLCADEPRGRIRSWANEAFLALGTPWINSGYTGPVLSVSLYVPGVGPCPQCVHRQVFGATDQPSPEPPTPGHPTSAPPAIIAGQLAAHMAVSLITGVVPVVAGALHGLSLVTPDRAVYHEFERDPDCTACGTAAVAEGRAPRYAVPEPVPPLS